MDLKPVVYGLYSRHHTRDPFCIAEACGIIVQTEPLGSIRGYYSCSHRHQVIHINQSLDWPLRDFVAAHELGHAILHPNANTPFLHEATFFSVDRLEVEANQFAALLMVTDDTLLELLDCSMGQVATSVGLPLPLAQWRVAQIQVAR